MRNAPDITRRANGLRLKSEDVVCASASEFEKFFDSQARRSVGLPGDTALKRIRSGKTKPSLAWTELVLLSALLEHK